MRSVKKLFTLLLLVLVVLPVSAQTERTIKRKVAIARFSNETQYGKGIFYDKENDPMSKQAMDILSSKLAASGKFILLEREDLDLLVAESGDKMDKIGADYVILGSINEFGRKTEGKEKVFTSTKSQVVEAGVSVRLVEASTGLIVYSDEAKGNAETTTKTTLGFGGTAGYDASLSDKAISAALSQLVDNIINKCMDIPWKSFLLDGEDGTYIMSGGASQGIKPADKFVVYKRGKTVTNPQTGMKVELPGAPVGEVTVVSSFGNNVENEMSYCTYKGQELDNDDLSKYYIMDK
ncbi:MAG: penicillin-binding protein activator LpoB [Bacteroidales bacterium]|nr:penicillin-binding protein activator LpoB [Bacteroidales bacterium]